jgi:hypothetical protein
MVLDQSGRAGQDPTKGKPARLVSVLAPFAAGSRSQ